MKKIIIITGIMLLAVTAFAQQGSRERERQKVQDHKSETTTRRTDPSTRGNNHLQANNTGRDFTRTSNDAAQKGKYQASRNEASEIRKLNSPEYNKTGKGNVGTTATNKHNNSHYTTPNRRPVRVANNTPHYTKGKSGTFHYRSPERVHVIWTPQMYRDYQIMYPDYRHWNYQTGYRIVTVPSHHAYFHVGEVRNIYGRVHETWYSWSTDEYYLYFGGTYPYQDFTVILSGKDARRFSRHPSAYFEGRYLWVTGLVSNFEGKPEIMVRRKSQVHLY